MGKCYITEYFDTPQRQGSGIQCGIEPGTRNANSPLTFTTHVESAAFGPETKFVRIHVDAICSFVFGENPIATTSDARMGADHTEIFGVYPGHKISVVSNT